jgi:DNA-binding NarL/FixJ family response regulator
MGRQTNPELRVGVVDGYPVARAGLSAFLGTEARIRLVGEAEDGEGALRLVAADLPDLVVLGYYLSRGPDGVRVCRSIKRAPQQPRVLVLAGSNFAEAMLPFFLAGADSYLHRRSTARGLSTRSTEPLPERGSGTSPAAPSRPRYPSATLRPPA